MLANWQPDAGAAQTGVLALFYVGYVAAIIYFGGSGREKPGVRRPCPACFWATAYGTYNVTNMVMLKGPACPDVAC